MNGRYALDTNAVIALIDGDPTVREPVVRADEIFIPSPVIGELYFGACRSSRVTENIQRVDDIVQWYSILPIDESTAKTYGSLKQQLVAAGTPIPDNDIWVVSISLQHGLRLFTRDQHFGLVPSLTTLDW